MHWLIKIIREEKKTENTTLLSTVEKDSIYNLLFLNFIKQPPLNFLES